MRKILLCIFTLSLLACDTDEIISQLFDGTVKADINGQSKTWEFGPNSVGATMTTVQEDSITVYSFGLAASSDGVSNNNETTTIAITIISDTPISIVSGATFTYPADLIGGTYSYDNEDGSVSIDGDDSVSATLHISSVNSSGSEISGTFSFETVDGDTGTTYTVSNGTFTNIPFYNN
jgi:hypothetical protein